MSLKKGYYHEPDFYYYFFPHPNSTVLDFIVLIDEKTKNAVVYSVRKLKKVKG